MNTHRMSCAEVREKLPLFVGGDLDGDVLEAVRGHLDLCAECARAAGNATRARRALLSAFRAHASTPQRPELWSGIRATLRSEGLIHDPARPESGRAPQTAPRARGVRWSLVLAPMAAAAAILAVAQLGGLFSPAPAVVPEPHHASPDVVATPISAPAHGLQRVGPTRESIVLPLPYRKGQQRREASEPTGSDISAAAYNGFK